MYSKTATKSKFAYTLKGMTLLIISSLKADTCLSSPFNVSSFCSSKFAKASANSDSILAFDSCSFTSRAAAVSLLVLFRALVVSALAALIMASASCWSFLISPELSLTPSNLFLISSSLLSMTAATGLNHMLSRATMRVRNSMAMMGRVRLKSKILPFSSPARAGNASSTLVATMAAFLATLLLVRVLKAWLTESSKDDTGAFPCLASTARRATLSTQGRPATAAILLPLKKEVLDEHDVACTGAATGAERRAATPVAATTVAMSSRRCHFLPRQQSAENEITTHVSGRSVGRSIGRSVPLWHKMPVSFAFGGSSLNTGTSTSAQQD
ncbi:hypothetical protein Mapa_010944 [Marchantia paleacea]|nr:hypothetical protein Mapa_010944 [Marchantia paleacea]